MALRSLAKGTWGPAACALRCRSGAGMPAAAPSRFLATIRNQVKQHTNGTRMETLYEEVLLLKELDTVFEALRQCDKDLEKLQGEVKRVVKIFAVSFAGLYSYALIYRWKKGEFTQPAAEGTSRY